MTRYDLAVVGGGFYGTGLALHGARELGLRTVLLERESALMQRASYANQARVHAGYHYPRNYVTALRSRVNAPRFIEEFRECIDDSFNMYYAIARRHSKVTARHFSRFCEHIGAPLRPAPSKVVDLFNDELVESVFDAPEFAFDAAALRDRMQRSLDAAGVEIRLQANVSRAAARKGGGIILDIEPGSEIEASRVLNCTYARTNALVRGSSLPPIPLKHELTELALVNPPAEIHGKGVTLMCGPFFSIMPFPGKGLYSLSHVRYTPHGSWLDDASTYRDAAQVLAVSRRESHFPAMVRDAARYLPALRETEYKESLWEIKTVRPKNEIDDGRPILFHHHDEIPGLISIMGSKLDNFYDVLATMSDVFPS